MKKPIVSLFKYWVGIAGVIGSIYFILNYANCNSFKIKCQEYYNIPAKYFSTSINSKLFFLLIMIFLALLIFLPAVLRWHKPQLKTKDNVCYAGIAILIALGIALINMVCLFTSMSTINWLAPILSNQTGVNILCFLVIIITIVVSLGLTFIDFLGRTLMDCRSNTQSSSPDNLTSTSNVQNFETILNKIITKIKFFIRKRIKTIFIIFIISFILCITLFVSFISLTLNYSINDKTTYEILMTASNKDNKEMIVLSDIDNYHALVSPVTITKYNAKNITEYNAEIDTIEYKIIDKTGLIMSWVNFHRITIKKSK